MKSKSPKTSELKLSYSINPLTNDSNVGLEETSSAVIRSQISPSHVPSEDQPSERWQQIESLFSF